MLRVNGTRGNFRPQDVVVRESPTRMTSRSCTPSTLRAERTVRRAAMELTINGRTRHVDVPADMPVLWVLRDVLGMTGTKFGCGMALCGACTVQLDGQAVRSCITAIDSVGDSKVTTIEAIGATTVGAKVQKAWLDHEVAQ